MRRAVHFLVVLWVLPGTVPGLLLGLLALTTGGSVHRRGRVLEFQGGLLPALLQRIPIRGGASAMTLGHTVLGCDQVQLDRCRDHELVHVRQFERWGPLFLPAYAACAVWLWLLRRDPYQDNPFEREAFGTWEHP